ncbi:MAG: YitT family protein [Chloroflexi bacterium]|nr:YitT family protein [Chloroflexota bacterium]MBP8059705.1 YitT family protein [Chloroflexota bacterium]
MKRLHAAHLWEAGLNLFTLVVGSVLSALGYALFLVPFNIAAGGVSGISIIINHYTGWPVGILYFVMNLPLLVLGFFYLGRWQFIWKTLIAVVLFSVLSDLFIWYLPQLLSHYPVNEDTLLNAVYGGIMGGVGAGFIYRFGGTMGGTSIVGRIIQQKTGAPLSQIFLYTDGIVILLAGLIFGWEVSLYALLTLFLSGLASDYTLEGPSSVRTATIITDKPEAVAQALIAELGRGVSQWQITGGYTGQTHSMVFCTVYRPQVNELKRVVATVDNKAFVVIGTAHQALGYGFTPLK